MTDRGNSRSLVRLRPRNRTIYVSRNRTVLSTGLDGFVHGAPHTGLFVDDTRMLSRYRYRAGGQDLEHVVHSAVEQHSWLGYYVAPPLPPSGAESPGEPPQHVVEVRISRTVGDGFHEDVDLTNFTQSRVAFALELEVDADFSGLLEQGEARKQEGVLTSAWREAEGGAWELVFDYRAENDYEHQGERGTARIHRSLVLRFEAASSPPSYRDGEIVFSVELEPHGTWHACVKAIAHVESETLAPLYGCRAFAGAQSERDVARGTFFHYASRFSAPAEETLTGVVIGALEQAKRDLAAMRLYDLDRGERAWTMAAGLPLYVSLFGRDMLTTAWQAALVSPDMLKGTLAELARWRGREVSDWRNEQPGKALHQARGGPVPKLNMSPWGRHYGSITASAFYPVTVSELWHWTGDRALVGPLIEPALEALRWLDTYGDADRDGFYEYETRSEKPQKNQAWKDSDEAIVHADGSQASPPTATCETQGFVYLAKLHMSELLFWFGRRDEAKRLYHEAQELKKRFNDAFWMEDEGFFAMGLDPKKGLIRSIGSNPIHCIATAIVDDALVERAVTRLFSADMFSGWGIRTLSSAHPAYNPYAYQRGSVWPVEQGTFALGLLRYELREHMEMLCRAHFEAAALFDHFRLPECFGGQPRDAAHPFPSLYPQANWPQAWSSSGLVCMLQAMLGIYPYAPLDLLLLDPKLPKWLPEITVENLHVGRAVASIRFWRTEKGETDFEVKDKRGRLHVLRQPSPWSLTTTPAERLKDALTSLAK